MCENLAGLYAKGDMVILVDMVTLAIQVDMDIPDTERDMMITMPPIPVMAILDTRSPVVH